MRWMMALLVGLCCEANGQPHSFKNLTLGMSQAQANADRRFNCMPATSALGDVQCLLKHTERETVAGRPVRVLSLFFYDDELYTISLTISDNDVNATVEALEERYGRWTKGPSNAFTWLGSESRIDLIPHGSNHALAALHFRRNGFLDKFEDRKKRRAQGASKDL